MPIISEVFETVCEVMHSFLRSVRELAQYLGPVYATNPVLRARVRTRLPKRLVKSHQYSEACVMGKQQVFRCSVGIDCSKDELVCALARRQDDDSIRTGRAKTFRNTSAGFASLLDWVATSIGPSASALFILEASGVYHEELTYCLHKAGHDVSVLVPRRARAFAEASGISTKTDAVDAAVLANFGLRQQPPVWRCPDPIVLKIKRLMRQYHSLVE